jgi:hypothetical protein
VTARLRYIEAGDRNPAGEGTMPFLKWVLIAVLLLVGVLFVYEGLGFDFRILNFESLDRYMLPIGSALIVVGVLLGRYWRTAD